MQVEIKAGVENIFAQKAIFPGLANRDFKPVYGNWIFRTDVNIALCRAHCIAADCHGLHDAVRIPLQNGTVHKRAGIALVRIADDVFLIRLVHGGQLPLAAGRESAAAAPAQAGILNHLDDLLRGVFRQALCQRLIAVIGDVFVDIFRVDDTAVAQRDALLLFIEISGFDALDNIVMDGIIIQQALDDAPFEQMLLHDLGDVLYLNFTVEAAFRIDDHDGAERAQAMAARLDDLDLFAEAFLRDLLLQSLDNRGRVCGGTAGTAANEYMGTIHCFSSSLIWRLRQRYIL